MRFLACLLKLDVAVLCMACFFACSNGGSAKPVEVDNGSGNSTQDTLTVAPGDSAGYTRVITETGDTIYVKDTVTIYPDTSLRWVGNSAVRITEIASLNLDWLDLDGDDPSWVEIYNAGTVSANLKGWALVENLKDPKKWVFGDEIVAAKSFRTVFCDKKNIPSVAGVSNGKDSDGKTLHSRPHTNWKLDKAGGTLYLVDPSNGIRDSVAYPELAGGVSWGIVDGGDWKYFGTPTPEKPNTEATAYDGMAPDADFSEIKSGFYNEPFTLNPPPVEEGAKLRCTTNGSAPTESSEEFTASKTIDHNMVLRCAVFKKGTITKKVVTRTFLVGEETVKMPIVAISVDSNFFRNHYRKTSCERPRGCPDSAALYADVEYPIHVEYFENGSSTKGGSTWEKDAGISLMGGYSRLNDKKSVSIRLREEYEDGSINYPLFETRKGVNDKYKAFNLRNNGNRYVSDYIEDAMAGAILEGSGVDYQRSRQVVVFYNGRYYGIHDMRERFNKHFVETNYNIDANSVNFIKHLGEKVEASNGTIDAYMNMLHFVATSKFDGENNSNYATVKTMLDVGNLADYMAAEIYVHNGDWPNNNVRAWSSPDQPWKFMVYDLDHGFDWTWGVNNGEFGQGTNMFTWIKKGGGDKPCKEEGCFANLYIQLIKNPDFKRMFINRSALMFNNYTKGANVEKVVDAMVATMDGSEMTRDLEKFKQDQKWYENSCGNGFSKTGSCMKSWAVTRDSKVWQEYQEEFGLSGTISVTVAADGSGQVLIEGAKLPSFPYTGKFFSGNKMELTAVPASGAVFTGWQDGNTDNPRIVSPTDGVTYTATFK